MFICPIPNKCPLKQEKVDSISLHEFWRNWKMESDDLDFFAFSTGTYHILLDKYDGKTWADKCLTCQVQFWTGVDKVDLHNFCANAYLHPKNVNYYFNRLPSKPRLPKESNSMHKNHVHMYCIFMSPKKCINTGCVWKKCVSSKSAPFYRVMCPKVILTQKVVKMTQIETFCVEQFASL